MTNENTKPIVTVTTGSKWFQKDEIVTISGTVTSSKTVSSLSVYLEGNYLSDVSYDANGNWSFTYTGADTNESNLTFVAENEDGYGVAGYTLRIDTAAPSITVGEFSGDSCYKDEATGKVWFQQNDTTATLFATITDDGSELESADYFGANYADGEFSGLITAMEIGLVGAIAATDKAGNVSQSSTVSYYVDGTGPAINVTHVPSEDLTFSVDVSANVTDEDGSGVKSVQYSFDEKEWFDYEGSFSVTSNSTIYFKAVDNVGNESTEVYCITDIDTVPLVVSINADTVTVQENVTFSVIATDTYTNITKLEYSIDGGSSWTACTIPADQKSVTVDVTAETNNTTFLFRATDQAGNTGEGSVTFNDIYKGTEETFEIIDMKTVTSDRPIDVDTLAMNGNATLVNRGTVEAGKLVVSGTGNIIRSTIVTEVDSEVYVKEVETLPNSPDFWVLTNVITDKTYYADNLSVNNVHAASQEVNAKLDISDVSDQVGNNTTDIYAIVDPEGNGSYVFVAALSTQEASASNKFYDGVFTKIVSTDSLSQQYKLIGEESIADYTGMLFVPNDAVLNTITTITMTNLVTAEEIELAEGAELQIDKDQYDFFMTNSEFTTGNGKLLVSASTGNVLLTSDVDTLMNKSNIANVSFDQDLIDINNLKLKSTKATTISFLDAYGTRKNDTIRFCKGTDVTFGAEDGVLDLKVGYVSFVNTSNDVSGLDSGMDTFSTGIATNDGKTLTLNGYGLIVAEMTINGNNSQASDESAFIFGDAETGMTDFKSDLSDSLSAEEAFNFFSEVRAADAEIQATDYNFEKVVSGVAYFRVVISNYAVYVPVDSYYYVTGDDLTSTITVNMDNVLVYPNYLVVALNEGAIPSSVTAGSQIVNNESTNFTVGLLNGGTQTVSEFTAESLNGGTQTVSEFSVESLNALLEAISAMKKNHVIDLKEGKNKIQVDRDANIRITSDLVNVSTVKTASGSTVELEAVTFQAGRNATLKAEGTLFLAGNITGTDKETSIRIGKETDFGSGAITLGDKSDHFTAGKDSYAGIGTIKDAEGGQLEFYGANVDFGGGNDKLKAQGTFFASGAIDFGTGNDCLTVGDNSFFLAADYLIGNWEEPEKADGTFTDIDFGAGNDKVSIGKSSVFCAKDVSSLETIRLEKYSTMQVEKLSGVKKLTVSSGACDKKTEDPNWTNFSASEVTGTDDNDSFNFGSYNDVDLTSLDFGAGNDTLKIGNYSKLDIEGTLDFGDGKSDKLTIGRNSTVSVASLNVDSLDKLSIGKGSYLAIADDTARIAAQEKFSKDADQIVPKLA